MELEDPCGSCSPGKDQGPGAAELMDEYWFYHNMVGALRILKPSIDANCSNTSKEMDERDTQGELHSTTTTLPYPGGTYEDPFISPNLLSTSPSLPPSQAEASSARSNGSKLRLHLHRSFSSVDDVPLAAPIANSRRSSSKADSSIEGSKMELKQSPYPLASEVNLCRQSQMRSCKSLSQLEGEEVQGFMDLGLVFDWAQLAQVF